jgi:hypothetical protein
MISSFTPEMEAFQSFSNQSRVFLNSYNDDAVYWNIARTIILTLVDDLNKPLTDIEHPFNLYAEEYSHNRNIRRLRTDVLAQLQTRYEQQVALAFFHHGGMQRDALEELMDYFYEFVDTCINNSYEVETLDACSDYSSDYSSE